MSGIVRVEVTLKELFCGNVDGDPGNSLEIKGHLFALVFNVRTHQERNRTVLFHPRSGYVSIPHHKSFPVNQRVTFDLREEAEYLHIGGQLIEDDDWPNPDDNMGEHWEKIARGQIGGANPRVRKIWFSSGNEHVAAIFDLKKI